MPVDFIGLGRAAADLGGFALFLVAVIVAAVGLWRRWWVPGWLYIEKANDVRDLTKAVERLTSELARERRRRSSDADR